MAEVVALVDDIFFGAKLAETARHVGVTLQMVSSGEALQTALAAPDTVAPDAPDGKSAPRLLLVDLNARQGPLEAIERLRAAGNSLPVIAFLSHVQTELAQRAAAAGCQRVLPRSKFTAELPEILRQAKS